MQRDIRFLHKTKYAKSYALVIGIDNYQTVRPLSHAVSDAEGVKKVLLEYMNFPEENVTCLLNENATKKDILKAYMRFAKPDIHLDDRVFIFFAGHGHTLTGGRGEVGFLVPCDADMSDPSTLIRWKELTDNAELVRAKHMLFVMDACYSGLALTRGLHAGSSRFLKDMMLRHSRQVITAGKADEAVADSGGPLPNHSVFTGHLIEGLTGKAQSEEGILTASGLMSYVYDKVAKDKNSNQTPHFGHFDGDGDFIFSAPQLSELEESDQVDVDRLIVVPYGGDEYLLDPATNKVDKVKRLLSDDTASIELHDFLVNEVRSFLAKTSEDNFKLQAQFSLCELQSRIAQYEKHSDDLTSLIACLAYWAKPTHQGLIQKIIARSSDRLEPTGGLSTWLALRWYPLILCIYSAGIAAVEARRYDSLASLLYTRVGSVENSRKSAFFADTAAEAILELGGTQVFKRLPGHENQFTPMSEYLFKVLQPKVDELLFVGKGYEDAFDEFEIVFSLVVADLRKQRDEYVRAPIGRFGWKIRHAENSPLSRFIVTAKAEGENWEGLRAGLFGGSSKRFCAIADEWNTAVSSRSWF